MLRVSFVIAVLCVVERVAYGTAEKKRRATCKTDQEETEVTAMTTYGDITIVCPENTALTPLEPQKKEGEEDKGNHVFVRSSDQADAMVVELGQTVPGASLNWTNRNGRGNGKFVLSIPQLPDTPQKLFFKCEGNAAECHIAVEVPASPPAGPNRCAVPSSELHFRASNPKSVVRFSCHHNWIPHPVVPGKVFDGTCQKEVDLEDVLPGAAYKPNNREDVTMQLGELPPENVKLCVICSASRESKPEEQCKVVIEVAGGNAGGAVGMTSRTALGLGLLAVACVYVL